MLDPARQLQVVEEWLDQLEDRSSIRVPERLTESYLRRNSDGVEVVERQQPYQVDETTGPALARMRSHKSSYEVPVKSQSILVLPEVWSPAYDWSGLFHIDHLPEVAGLSVLEIGCGTGLISVAAAQGGAASVQAVDVNPRAVENARLNFARLGLHQCRAYVSDGFSEVRGKFDLIIWNAPYHGAPASDMLERGCCDEDYHATRAFFRNVTSHLRPGGCVQFGCSESGDLQLIYSLIRESGLRARRKLADWRDGYNVMIIELERKGEAAASGIVHSAKTGTGALQTRRTSSGKLSAT
jgi:2-polyprenyl-3-methyl-5-hydroxy-6-metoxy-1,4-benzoquinol methylase